MSNDRNKKKDVSNVTKYGMRDKKGRSKKKGGGGGGGGIKLAPTFSVSNRFHTKSETDSATANGNGLGSRRNPTARLTFVSRTHELVVNSFNYFVFRHSAITTLIWIVDQGRIDD